MYYVPKVWPRSYLSVVVFQNKLSNVISGSFIIHLAEQTTSYFVIHHFKNDTLYDFSNGQIGPMIEGKLSPKILASDLPFFDCDWMNFEMRRHFIIHWSQLLKDCFVKSAQLDQVGICKLDIGLQHRSGRGEHLHQHRHRRHHQHLRHHHQHHLDCHHQHRRCKLDIGHGCTPPTSGWEDLRQTSISKPIRKLSAFRLKGLSSRTNRFIVRWDSHPLSKLICQEILSVAHENIA